MKRMNKTQYLNFSTLDSVEDRWYERVFSIWQYKTVGGSASSATALFENHLQVLDPRPATAPTAVNSPRITSVEMLRVMNTNRVSISALGQRSSSTGG